MLTNITGFTNLEDNTQVTSDDLAMLYKNVVMPDVVNLQGEDMSKGFSSSAATEIVNKVESPVTSKVCILCDFSFNVYYELCKSGFQHSNIYIAFGKWETYKKGREDHVRVAKDNNVFRIMKKIAVNSFKEFNEHPENIIELKDIFDMEFDLIISNPPYKAIGALITKSIVDNVNFNEFVNLMPINDYTRAPGLINYVKDSSRLGFKAFAGQASIDPYICHVSKTACNNYSEFDFDLKFCRETVLERYYRINNDRKDKYITLAHNKIYAKTYEEAINELNSIDINTTFMLTDRCAVDGVHYKDSTSHDVKWNIVGRYTAEDADIKKNVNGYGLMVRWYNTTSAINKLNLTNFWYQNDVKANLMSRIIWGLHKQSGDIFEIIPQVDWSHPWTERELLADYGYSDEEIDYILSDEFLAEVTRA